MQETDGEEAFEERYGQASELAVQAVYKGTGAKGGWNGGKGPCWSVQKYFNSGKDEKKKRIALKRGSGPEPEARQEEKGKRKAAKVTPEFAGAEGKVIVSRELEQESEHCRRRQRRHQRTSA